MPDEHSIPSITDPLGSSWKQPNRLEILVDETHALMSKSAFDLLQEYNTDTPTALYGGKMWRMRVSAGKYTLYWCAENQGGLINLHHRAILVV